MKKTKTIELGQLSVDVTELTVGEVREWLNTVEKNSEPDVLNEMLLGGAVALSDLTRFSTITLADIDGLTQSELSQLVEVAKELNPHFFALRERLMSFLPTS